MLSVSKLGSLPTSAPALPLISWRWTTVSCGSMRRMVVPESSSSHAHAPHEPHFGAAGANSEARRSSMLGSSSAAGTVPVPSGNKDIRALGTSTSSPAAISPSPSSLPLSLSESDRLQLLFDLRVELRLPALSRSHLSTIPRTWPFRRRCVGWREQPASASPPVSRRSSELDDEAYSVVPKGDSSCTRACSCSRSGSDGGLPQIRP